MPDDRFPHAFTDLTLHDPLEPHGDPLGGLSDGAVTLPVEARLSRITAFRKLGGGQGSPFAGDESAANLARIPWTHCRPARPPCADCDPSSVAGWADLRHCEENERIRAPPERCGAEPPGRHSNRGGSASGVGRQSAPSDRLAPILTGSCGGSHDSSARWPRIPMMRAIEGIGWTAAMADSAVLGHQMRDRFASAS